MLRKLAGETAWYGLSSILGRMVNYLLVPFYTVVLSPAGNGAITELYSWAAILQVVLTFGMETTFFRFAAQDTDGKAAQRAQTLIGVLCLVAFALTGIFIQPLAAHTGYEEGRAIIWLLASVLALDALSAIPLSRLRLEQKPRQYAGLRLLSIGLNVFLNVVLLWILPTYFPSYGESITEGDRVLGVVLANLIGNSVFLIQLRLKDFVPSLLTKPQMGTMVHYAWPLALMGLAGMLSEMGGRLLLEPLLPQGYYLGLTNKEALGVYGNCYKLSIFMSLVVQAFRLGAEPFFFRQGGVESGNGPAYELARRKVFGQVMWWFTIACSGILLAVSLNLDWLGSLLLRRPVYRTGLGVVPILLAANLWMGVNYTLSVWYKRTDKTHWGSILAVGGAVVTLGLNVLLIPLMGYYGSALATLLVYFLMAMSSYLIGQKYYRVPYSPLRIVVLVGVCLLVSVGFGPVSAYSVEISWVYRLVIGGGFAAFVWWEWKNRPAVA
jgi:O-antigen/teichoic acid export membrane protein